MTSHPNKNLPTTDQELLVAYLDGELDSHESTGVEQRLAQDVDFRALLSKLRETWDLLDDLPQPTVDEGFAQTTVEMVAVQAADESRVLPSNGASRQRYLWMAACLVAAIASFGVVRQWQTAGDRQLIQDLPVIENVDAYLEVQSLEFLEALAQSDVFRNDEIDREFNDASEEP